MHLFELLMQKSAWLASIEKGMPPNELIAST